MISREILYERNLTGSYMKVPAAINASFDEKIMLKRKLPGLLPVEKCYVNSIGQYWYNISGKQSLDSFCKIKKLGIDFVERMIISICNEIDILELNLLDVNSLMLDPELIFVTNRNSEVIFTVYPGESSKLSEEFSSLMEFLITKVDHSDSQAVSMAYSLYEKSLDDMYSLLDIRDEIVRKKENEAIERRKDRDEDLTRLGSKEYKESKNRVVGGKKANGKKVVEKKAIEKKAVEKKVYEKKTTEKENDLQKWKALLTSLWQKTLAILRYKPGENNSSAEWIMPEAQYDESIEFQREPLRLNPTICLSDYGKHPKGILKYEGTEALDDITLEEEMTRIGQGGDVEIIIDRETISHYHARIERDGDTYYVEDLNSTNGTAVNGSNLSYKERRKLNINDLVSFADLEYKFV